MTVEDDRDNSPLEDQIFGVLLYSLHRFFQIIYNNLKVSGKHIMGNSSKREKNPYAI
jgi:hypothetical protein